MADAAGGTYTLLVVLSAPATVAFGAAGERALAAGCYAYTGSALGPGGFARVERHREVGDGTRDVRHWHVDHVLGHPASRVVGDVRTADVDAECAVAGALADALAPVPGVGASDCDCGSHLAGPGSPAAVDRAARRAHERAAG